MSHSPREIVEALRGGKRRRFARYANKIRDASHSLKWHKTRRKGLDDDLVELDAQVPIKVKFRTCYIE